MIFEHDKLVAHIRHVNPRTERHGEEEKLACDVSLKIVAAENTDAWSAILKELHYGAEDAQELVGDLSEVVTRLPYVAAYQNHKANFWQGNRKIASLTQAKVNKFTWAQEEGVQFLTLRIQALADGETVGKLSELIEHKVRIEVVAQQGELPLGKDEGSED